MRIKRPNDRTVSIEIFDGLTLYYNQPTLSQYFEWFVEHNYHRVKECFKPYPDELIPFEVDIYEDTAIKWDKLSKSQKQLLVYWFNQVMMEKVQALLLERR